MTAYFVQGQTQRVILAGRRLKIVSDGGTVTFTTKAELKRSILRIITSDGFSQTGCDGLAQSTRDYLLWASNAIRFAEAA